MAYDEAHGQTVLFGGNGLGMIGDTWLWDGSNWKMASQTGPSAREAHSMAYDSVRHQIVLFGGFDGTTALNDTWVWDGFKWTQKFPQTNPPARSAFGMAYDSAHQQVVLFGGEVGFNVLNDTWVWDGSNWMEKSPKTSPSARAIFAMAYDSAHGQTVLFAGFPNGPVYLSDTWVWDGSDWTQESPKTSPPLRAGHAMAFDSDSGQVLLFGGSTGTANLNDTWVWDGSNWTKETPLPALLNRQAHTMSYDSALKQVVLFGGSGNVAILSDTWTWAGVPKVTPPPPPPPPPVPTISGVVSATAFGGFSSVAPGSWIEIYGSNFATDTHGWTSADFTGNHAPITLGGVKATIGGQAAFVDYVSPGQVDVQLPSSIATGTLQLALTNANGTSAPQSLTVQAAEPGLLAPASFKIGAYQYVVAQFIDGTYVLPTGAIAGVTSRPAKPGDTIIIYGVGFGAVTPNIPAGEIVTEHNQLTQTFEMEFGTAQAQVPYFGLAPNLVGVYQFNVVVPDVLDNDLVPLTFKLGGVAGTQTLFTAVHH